MKQTDAARLTEEYNSLVRGLQQRSSERDEDNFLVNPGKSTFVSNMVCFINAKFLVY